MNILGIDIGGTKCAVILGNISDEGRLSVIDKIVVQTRNFPNPYQMIEKLQQELYRLLETHSTGIETIASIGISCGGPLDSEMGIILSPPNLPDWD